jgi:DNA-binding IclR family transcriptional regulator
LVNKPAVGVNDRNAPGRLLDTISITGSTARLDRKNLESLITSMEKGTAKVGETWTIWAAVNNEPERLSANG